MEDLSAEEARLLNAVAQFKDEGTHVGTLTRVGNEAIEQIDQLVASLRQATKDSGEPYEYVFGLFTTHEPWQGYRVEKGVIEVEANQLAWDNSEEFTNQQMAHIIMILYVYKLHDLHVSFYLYENRTINLYIWEHLNEPTSYEKEVNKPLAEATEIEGELIQSLLTFTLKELSD